MKTRMLRAVTILFLLVGVPFLASAAPRSAIRYENGELSVCPDTCELEHLIVKVTAVGGEVITLEPGPQTVDGTAISVPFARDAYRAVLRLRQIDTRVVVSADYSGPPLAGRDSFIVQFHLPDFNRGLAFKRINTFWTAPSIVSGFRLLSGSNHFLLWKGVADPRPHYALAALAGGGMVAELGIGDVDSVYKFRVAVSSDQTGYTPHGFPVFAFNSGEQPREVTQSLYRSAFAESGMEARSQVPKFLPEPFRNLGWCSWNAYEKRIDEQKILHSADSFHSKGIPVRSVLIDDGWLSSNGDRLTGFQPNPEKFPNGFAPLVNRLKSEYGVVHVGVWHALQGYWDGIDPESPLGRNYPLLRGNSGRYLIEPGAAGRFYSDWYAELARTGVDFIKIDNQGNNSRFTRGRLPLLETAHALQSGIEAAVDTQFAKGSRPGRGSLPNLEACMSMTLESVFSWSRPTVMRTSNDYLPNDPSNAKDHVFHNAYNAFWASNFAYPDWDMFQSHDARAEYHALARALSGGPIWFTDEPGKENAGILQALSFADGTIPRPDGPGMVSSSLLYRDPSIEQIPLSIESKVNRLGLQARLIGVFNVNKLATRLQGSVRLNDLDSKLNGKVAVLQRSTQKVSLLDSNSSDSPIAYGLDEFGSDLFILSAIHDGTAVFGLVDKYVAPAGVVSVRGNRVVLKEAGDFAAYTEARPVQLKIDGKQVPAAGFTWSEGLLRIPKSSFSPGKGNRIVEWRADGAG